MYLTYEQAEQVTDDLVAFIHRVAKGDATPEENLAMAEIAKVLLPRIQQT